MTVSAGAYNPANHTVTVTVTGGSAGNLILYETFPSAPAPQARVVADQAYNGTSAVIVDRFPADGTREYLAFVDGTPNGTDTVAVTVTDQWIISLSDAANTLKVCAVRDGREQWRGRRRRGWWGNVVGQVRTVAVTDVTMGTREGRLSLLVTADQINNMDNLLKQGIVCFRGPEPRTGFFALILDYQDRPAGSGDDPWWLYDVQHVQVDPAGFLGTIPD